MSTEPKATQEDYDNSAFAGEDAGYEKGLKPRQLQMIARTAAIAVA